MMSRKLKTRGLRPIGLDIGHHSIKMIQLAISDDQIDVVAANEARVDASVNGDRRERRKFIISTIKRMLAEGHFRGKSVVSCLPNDKLKITSLRLAEMETAQIEQALAKEAVHRFGLDPNKDAINYMLAGSVRHGDEIKNELILFATDDETIKNHIAMLEEAQLRPVAIDAIPCAFYRSFERSLRRREDREQTIIFVDIGSRFTTMVFGRGGEICFIKQITIGGERFNREIGARLGISINEVPMLRGRLRMEKGLPAPQLSSASGPAIGDRQGLDASTRQVMVDAITAIAEELAREMSLCFRYYTVTFRGKRVQRAIFSGGEAYENILLDVLRQRLRIEISVAQPLKGFHLPSGITSINLDGNGRGLLCEWAVAVGLSLKGWKWVPTPSRGRQVPPVERRAFGSPDTHERN